MNIRYIMYFLGSLVLSFTYYLVTKNLILTLVVFLLFFIFFLLIFDSYYSNYKRRLSRSFEAISFINNFLISLSVTNSILSTYEKMKEGVSKSLKSQMESIEHLDVENRIEYLYKYFDLPLYGVFINIIKQYLYNGGEILKISQLLIHDSRMLEEDLSEFNLVGKRKFKEFLFSWALSFLILIIIQFSFKNLTSNVSDIVPLYPYLILVFYLIFLVMLFLIMTRIYDISFLIKGDSKYDQKNKREDKKVKFRSKKRINKIHSH